MANTTFYKDYRKKRTTFSGGLRHYSYRPNIKVIQTTDYTLAFGETMFTLAYQQFGIPLLYNIIFSLNPPRPVDSWLPGESIKIPKVLVTNTYDEVGEYYI